MVKRLCITRLGEDEYGMVETPNGAYVSYEDYLSLKEKYDRYFGDSAYDEEEDITHEYYK